MCDCVLVSELGDIAIDAGRAYIYESNGDFIMDFPVEYCPFCGKKPNKVEGE